MTIISERRGTMTTKFKAGDKVIRTEHYDVGGDSGFMYKGRECIVKSMPSQFLLEVEGSGMHYDIDWFELAKEPPTFKAMKFRVTSPEHSKEIQEALFSMGYGWELYGKQLKSFKDFYGNLWLEKWLHTDEDGILYRSDEDPDSDVTPSSPFYHQECTIKTTKSYELIPVEIPKEEPVSPSIEVDGITYTSKEVAQAIEFLKLMREKADSIENRLS
jgi:hypothetical protein